jgi:hypothetical protein
MTVDRRTRAIASAIASGGFVLLILCRGSRAPVSEWIFLALWMLLSGWGAIFNLTTLCAGRAAEAFTVHYPDDGDAPDRPMSPRFTTVVMMVFWINGGILLMTAAR